MAANVNPLTGTITDALNNAWSYTVDQCTRFVAGALSWIPSGLGDAGDWLRNAQAKGLPTAGPNITPPPGAVAVWGRGTVSPFGHVAEVVSADAQSITVAEENWKGPGITDLRTLKGPDPRGIIGFILPPGGFQVPNPGQAIGGIPGQIGEAVASAGAQAAGAAATSVGHGVANAGGALVQNAGIAVKNQLVPLVVALVVAIVLFGGDESK